MKAPKNFYNTVDQRKLGLEDGLLPDVTAADNGKVLKVTEGAWAPGTDNGLPAVTAADAGKVLTVDENGNWIPFDAPQGDTWGDITWDKELVESWDFTESLEGSEGDTFTITAGASRTSDGLVFDGSAPTITCNLKNLVSDWLEVGVRMVCESEWNVAGAPTQISFFGCEGGLFEMFDSKAFNQVFPRDYYTPDVKQRMIFRDFYVDPYYGLYSFNRYMAGSNSTQALFTKFNDNIKDGDKLFVLGGYNNYGTPPAGFKIKKLEIYRRITGGET